MSLDKFHIASAQLYIRRLKDLSSVLHKVVSRMAYSIEKCASTPKTLSIDQLESIYRHHQSQMIHSTEIVELLDTCLPLTISEREIKLLQEMYRKALLSRVLTFACQGGLITYHTHICRLLMDIQFLVSKYNIMIVLCNDIFSDASLESLKSVMNHVINLNLSWILFLQKRFLCADVGLDIEHIPLKNLFDGKVFPSWDIIINQYRPLFRPEMSTLIIG